MSVLLCGHPFLRYKFVENLKNRKCTEWSQTGFNILAVKSTSYTLSAHPRGPNFGPFRSTTSRFRDTRLSKFEMHPKWSWRLNSQKYLAYSNYLPQRPTFWSLSLYDQPISRYGTCYNSPLTTMLNIPPPKKRTKKIARNPTFKQLWGSPYEYTWIWESKNLMYTQRKNHLNYSHMVPC